MGNTPNIRFKGFTDDWEQRKLGEFCNIVTGKLDANAMVEGGRYDFYTSGIQKYKIDTAAFEGPAITIAGNGATVGYMHLADGLFNAYQRTYVLSDFSADRQYLYSEIGRELPKKIAAEARTGNIPYIVMNMLTDLEISVPIAEEQQKIGKYFGQLDFLITLHQRKCDETKKLKKFMLQKMFPKKDEKKPEIRFADFTDDWEQRKLGWLVDNDVIEAPKDGNHGEKHPTSDEYVEEGIPFLMASDIRNGRVDLENCKYITKERAEQLDKGFAREGDVLLTHKATIGEVAILEGLQEEYAMLTPQVTYYRILDNKRLSQKYLYAVFHSESFQNEMQTKAAQSTRPYIGISAQQNLTISLPCSTEEQQRIGEYFASLDTLITLHQRKCDEIKEIKKFMLQNMFPQKG